jgi:hypothetical protein
VLISELLSVLTKAQTVVSDGEVVLKRIEGEGEKTFIHDIELALTGDTGTVAITHSPVATGAPVDTPAASVDPTPAPSDSSDA